VAFETSHTEVEARLLRGALVEGAYALEAGCGRTTRLSEYRGRIARLVGVDLDTAAGEENDALDEFVTADLSQRLPFDDASFDLVYANFVVEHLATPAHTFHEWRRVLRPGGSLVLLTSNRANPFMAAARMLPQRLRVAVKHGAAGAAERDVFPTLYLANTPERLETLTREAGFALASLAFVATLHRYGARVPGAGQLLRMAERALPERRRSTIVAWFRAA
jgi:SAM-dependent methyltransferase